MFAFQPKVEFGKNEFQNQSNYLNNLTRILFIKKISKNSLNTKFCRDSLPEGHTRKRRYGKFEGSSSTSARFSIWDSKMQLKSSCLITIVLHDVAHFFKDFHPLWWFSSRVANIKKKVDNIRYFDTLHICPSPVASSSTTAGKVSETYNSFSRNDHHILVGITRRVGALLDRVSRGDQPRDVVISVIEDLGSGKSTIIHEVFEIVKN